MISGLYATKDGLTAYYVQSDQFAIELPSGRTIQKEDLAELIKKDGEI